MHVFRIAPESLLDELHAVMAGQCAVPEDILKFHVHEGTRVGVVLVPRYKWISSRRTDTNFAAALKALTFADSFMNVDALVAIAYNWEVAESPATWRLAIVNGS